MTARKKTGILQQIVWKSYELGLMSLAIREDSNARAVSTDIERPAFQHTDDLGLQHSVRMDLVHIAAEIGALLARTAMIR
jgi:hypothetical protein